MKDGSGGAGGRGPEALRPVLRRERRLVWGRLAALLATVAAAGGLVGSGRPVWALAAAALAGLQAQAFVRRTEQPARDLLRFLDGLRSDDLSTSFAPGRGPLLAAVRAAFADLNDAFRRVRGDREEQALYLQTIVRHVGIALVAVRDDGEIALYNETAARVLGIARPGTLAVLARRHPALAAALGAAAAGGRMLVEVERHDEPLTLIVHTTRFQMRGARFVLASLQDIRPELEQRETEAWRQLTRVLTHEIMNSVAPIASLAATARDLLGETPAAGTGAAVGIEEALRVIERRCEGLVGFVESYRSLARLPDPVFRIVSAREVLGGITGLLGATAAERGVALACEVEPPGLELVADPDLLEQALINVVLNAIEAVAGRGAPETGGAQPGAESGGHSGDAPGEGRGPVPPGAHGRRGAPAGRVTVRGRVAQTGRVVVEVEDDGPGILPEVQERVFVPFFSTRAGGSGIGLSLARQIMRLHGGTLTVRSAPEQGATFAFRF